MTLNREGIAYADAKIREVRFKYELPDHLEMDLHHLAIEYHKSRFELQSKAEKSARALSEFIEKLKPGELS